MQLLHNSQGIQFFIFWGSEEDVFLPHNALCKLILNQNEVAV